MLALVCMIMMPLLGALTLEITRHEKLKVSHAAILKQVSVLSSLGSDARVVLLQPLDVPWNQPLCSRAGL
jgi:hypothetical protein